MTSQVKPINDEIKKRFYPMVKNRGFIKQKSIEPHFVEFRRATENGEDIFDIQWDKYWRPYFVVNFSKTGGDNPAWKIAGRLQRKRGGPMSCWFSLYPPFVERITTLKWRYTPGQVITELMQAFEELETWWSNGEVGPHINIVNCRD